MDMRDSEIDAAIERHVKFEEPPCDNERCKEAREAWAARSIDFEKLRERVCLDLLSELGG